MKKILLLFTALAVALVSCNKEIVPPQNENLIHNDTKVEALTSDYTEGEALTVYVDVWMFGNSVPGTVPQAYEFYAQVSQPVPCTVTVTANTGETFTINPKELTSATLRWPFEYGEYNAENSYSVNVSPAFVYDKNIKYVFQCDR